MLDGHAIAQHLYKRNRGIKSNNEIIKMISDALQPFKCKHGFSQYLIINFNKKIILNNHDLSDSINSELTRNYLNQIVQSAQQNDELFINENLKDMNPKEIPLNKLSF